MTPHAPRTGRPTAVTPGPNETLALAHPDLADYRVVASSAVLRTPATELDDLLG